LEFESQGYASKRAETNQYDFESMGAHRIEVYHPDNDRSGVCSSGWACGRAPRQDVFLRRARMGRLQ
jgi:hypothetical protein